MKKLHLLLLLTATFTLFSCEKSIEEPARLLLAEAQELYAADEYNSARILIDSISMTYPKAYKTRREAEILRREVMLKEKQRDVEYFTGMYDMLVERRDSLVTGFTFNKDAQYQDMGYYTVPSQAIALNPFNSFLRASVKENGDAYLASYYRGAKISHKTLKVSSGESFVICENPFSSRSYWYLGVYNERRDYRYGADDGVMDFIASATDPVKVNISGEQGKYEYMLRDDDAKAIKRVIELSNLLKMVEEARSMRDEAQRSLDFLIKSQQRSQENATEASVQ
ncbi:MAG: hypothetical protein IKY85_05200 [Bacteroidaceae bacterium]|nr:hypothetical protein [Bacteroidaceae bacterium]